MLNAGEESGLLYNGFTSAYSAISESQVQIQARAKNFVWLKTPDCQNYHYPLINYPWWGRVRLSF